MSDHYTFEAKSKTADYVLTVEKAFLEKCPNPETIDVFDLNAKHLLFRFLSNPVGPAVIRKNAPAPGEHYKGKLLVRDGNRYEYWVKGRLLNVEQPEQAERMHHAVDFEQRLDVEVST